MSSSSAASDGLDRKLLAIASVVVLGAIMSILDTTVVNVAINTLSRDFDTPLSTIQWIVTGYTLALATVIPVTGWAADRFGTKRLYMLSIGLFIAGSALSGAAWSAESLIAFRVLQGLGGGMLMPAGMTILTRAAGPQRVGRVMAIIGVPMLLGPILGPILGGWLVDEVSWRWIFFINLPIGLLGIALATLFFEDVREEDVAPLDIKGFLLSSSGFAALMLGLATGGRHLVPEAVSYACVAGGIAALVAYWFHARGMAYPVLNLSLLRIPTYRVGVLGGSIFRTGIGAIPFLLPLMLQLGFGLDALQSGLITFASAAGALLMKTLAKTILAGFGFRRVLTVNALIGSAFLAASGLFTPATPHWIMLAILLIGGCFRSLQFTGINALSYADVSNRDMSSATSLSSVSQQLSLSLGVTLGAFALEATNAFHGGKALGAGDFWPAFFLVGLISASSALWMARLQPEAGAEVSGHAPFSARKATAQKPLE
jgi:EmrB/QacA subfamily drug resistance transporter